LQHQEQLRPIQLLTLRTEEPPDKRLDFFPQQFVFRPQLRQFTADTCIFRRRQSELFAQLFLPLRRLRRWRSALWRRTLARHAFAWRLFGHRAYSTPAPFKRSLIFAPVC
jgi:hypothetical protein